MKRKNRKRETKGKDPKIKVIKKDGTVEFISLREILKSRNQEFSKGIFQMGSPS